MKVGENIPLVRVETSSEKTDNFMIIELTLFPGRKTERERCRIFWSRTTLPECALKQNIKAGIMEKV
jgi:hypothetical protein